MFKKSFLPSFKSIRKGLHGAFGIVFKAFGAILSPIGNVVKGTLNAIIHPIQTIKKVAHAGIFGILKTMFKSPSYAYTFGFILGLLYYKVIEPPFKRYILLPLVKLENFLLKDENKSVFNPLTDAIKKIA